METIVMSVGGSLIVPGGIDIEFLKKLKTLIVNAITHDGRRFIIIAGGGKTARHYQDAARSVSQVGSDDLDWIGIHATRLNGHLLRTIFKEIAHPVMVTNPEDILEVPESVPLIVAAGYHPGASTDYRAVQIAGHVDAKKVINLSNTDYIYTADPRKDADAKALEDITWSDFRKLIPREWDPGLSSPFDPIAAKAAEQLGIEVASINGAHLDELAKYLKGDVFVGTKIHS